MEKPLLSIVVPTKDRYPYLKALVYLIDSFNCSEIELVIQDNSDNNLDFKKYLEGLNSNFIKYYYQKGQIPMSKNSDLAIMHSTGEFVCFIGDDDGITIDIIECVKKMKQEGLDAITGNCPLYYWPEVGKSRFLEMGGRIVYNAIDSYETILYGKRCLCDVLEKGCIDRGRMPIVYHAIIKRSILDKIFDISGSYFPGNSPDISNAVACSLMIDSFKHINTCFTISGVSKYHGGGAGLQGDKHPRLENFKWFLPETLETWDKRVPYIGEGECIWCDSAIRSLKKMKREDMVNHINFEYLYAYFAASHKDIWRMSFSLSNRHVYFYIVTFLLLIERYFSGVINILFGKLGMIVGKRTAIGLDSIVDASNYMHVINSRNHYE